MSSFLQVWKWDVTFGQEKKMLKYISEQNKKDFKLFVVVTNIFSLSLDSSSDISCIKNFGIVLIFHNSDISWNTGMALWSHVRVVVIGAGTPPPPGGLAAGGNQNTGRWVGISPDGGGGSSIMYIVTWKNHVITWRHHLTVVGALTNRTCSKKCIFLPAIQTESTSTAAALKGKSCFIRKLLAFERGFCLSFHFWPLGFRKQSPLPPTSPKRQNGASRTFWTFVRALLFGRIYISVSCDV